MSQQHFFPHVLSFNSNYIAKSFALMCLTLFSSSFMCAGEDPTDTAFYAVSSLRSYFETIDEKDCDKIDYSPEEVETLWKKALQASDCLAIQEAKKYAADPDFNSSHLTNDNTSTQKIQSLLYKAWKELRSTTSHLRDTSQSYKYDILTKKQLSHPYTKSRSISKKMWESISPYVLPKTHLLSQKLDRLFSSPAVVQSNNTYAQNGFNIFCAAGPLSYVRVARHPQMPGYVFKFYPESESRQKDNTPSWKWLVMRCQGAKNVRRLISQKKLQLFTVPKKWLYPFPFGKRKSLRHPLLLVANDMQLVSLKESFAAWKEKVTKKHLEELYEIISHGYCSCYLPGNIPYTKNGTFTCIDTEHPQRKLAFWKVKRYLADDMKPYWDKLVKNGGKKK